jgi:hypothetical protein
MLPAPHRRLIELMQRLNHGRIESLAIRNGGPAFDPPPRVVQDIKLGGENGPRPELQRDDFELRSQVTELFEHLARLGNGVVTVLEVKHGLPFKLVIEQTP